MQTSDVERFAEAFRPLVVVKNFCRAMIVLVYCYLGASFASTPMIGLRFEQFPEELIPRLGFGPWFVLALVLIRSVLLSVCGKRSASWAVLAFGSLSTTMLTLLVTKIWYELDTITEAWMGTSALVAVSFLLIYFGFKAAHRAEWLKMFLCSVPVFFLAVVFGVSVNYAQYSYCSRHNLPKSTHTATATPAVKAVP